MLKKVLIVSLICYYHQLPAQINMFDSVAHQRNRLNQQNMIILGSWAAGNLLYSGVAIPQNTGTEKYFHQMNLYWNIVNLGIAGFSYYNGKSQLNKAISTQQNLQQQQSMEKILLINTGLDIGYMATGFYLMNRSKQQHLVDNQFQMKGFGQSLVLQGGFLLLFDVYQYLAHRANGKPLKQAAAKANFSINGDKLSFVYHF